MRELYRFESHTQKRYLSDLATVTPPVGPYDSLQTSEIQCNWD
jgi:hypothetical protein